jgi:hypothetical protein
MLRNPLPFSGVGLLALMLSTPALVAADAVTAAAWQRLHAKSRATLATIERTADVLPTGEPGVVDVSFREFFAPAGDAGLEYSAKLRDLAGKRVRLTGYMVREPKRQRGVFVLSPFPTTVESSGVCVTDDVPAVAVHVLLPAAKAETPVPFQPGRLVLTGVLELGPRPEADGRNSVVRLRLEAPAGVVTTNPATAASFLSP